MKYPFFTSWILVCIIQFQAYTQSTESIDFKQEAIWNYEQIKASISDSWDAHSGIIKTSGSEVIWTQETGPTFRIKISEVNSNWADLKNNGEVIFHIPEGMGYVKFFRESPNSEIVCMMYFHQASQKDETYEFKISNIPNIKGL